MPVSHTTTRHFVVKTEPETYSWMRLEQEGRTRWDGVRNYEARNHLRAMQIGDPVLVYHSGSERCVVGVGRVVSSPYPDPTASDGDWSAVDIEPVRALGSPVHLAVLRSSPALHSLALVRRPRLSVSSLSHAEFSAIVALGR